MNDFEEVKIQDNSLPVLSESKFNNSETTTDIVYSRKDDQVLVRKTPPTWITFLVSWLCLILISISTRVDNNGYMCSGFVIYFMYNLGTLVFYYKKRFTCSHQTSHSFMR